MKTVQSIKDLMGVLVIGHWSLVISHWSLVIGHWSLIILPLPPSPLHTTRELG
jgi:hypothetical protein